MKPFLRNLRVYNLLFFIGLFLILQSCRKDPQPLPSENEEVVVPDPDASIIGFYLLNEGNMNMNKASLDFMNLQTGDYQRNIYHEVNPEISKGLGDVGNDLAIYGSKLYVVEIGRASCRERVESAV